MRVGIPLVEVYGRVAGKSVISVCKKAQSGKQMKFVAVKSYGNVLVLYVIHILNSTKDYPFIAVKRDARFETWYVKGVPIVNIRYTKWVPFLSKVLYKKVRAWTSGRSLLVQNFV